MPTKPSCSEAECTNQAFRKGLCSKHYHRQLAKPCTVCGEPSIAGGLCNTHYYRVQRRVTTDAAFIRGDDEARFWSHVDRRGDDECWLWTGSLNAKGYSQFKVGDTNVAGHRWAYERFVGPIPDGLTIDHVWDRGCTNRSCVNPAHLEAVTNRENLMRGNGACAVNARKTHCKHGHEFTPENTGTRKDGNRYCKTCNRASRPSATLNLSGV